MRPMFYDGAQPGSPLQQLERGKRLVEDQMATIKTLRVELVAAKEEASKNKNALAKVERERDALKQELQQKVRWGWKRSSVEGSG